MTDTRIAHAFSGHSDDQSLLALLSETLDMTRDLKQTQGDIEAVGIGAEQAKELIASAGLADEIEAAEKTAQATVLEILNHVSEKDLEHGR